VTDDLLHHVRRGAEIQEQCHAGMPEIVKARGAEPGPAADIAPAAAEIVRLHRSAAPGREDQAMILPVGPHIGPLGELPLPVLA
jgi:hypothetical protein